MSLCSFGSRESSPFDNPQIILLIGHHLNSHELGTVLQVSRRWHNTLRPLFWHTIHLKTVAAHNAFSSPETLKALLVNQEHVRELVTVQPCLLLPLFRSLQDDDASGHTDSSNNDKNFVQGFCLLGHLSKLVLSVPDDDDDDLDLDRKCSNSLGSALIARAAFEKSRRSIRALAQRNHACEHGKPQRKEKVEDYTFRPPPTRNAPEAEWMLQHQAKETQEIIHSIEIESIMNMLRHNRGLRILVIHNFPSWSQNAIRALSRDWLPVLEELDLLSARSAMVSTMYLRILLKGLTPKLKRLKLTIGSTLYPDDDAMTLEQLQEYWSYHGHEEEQEEDFELQDLTLVGDLLRPTVTESV